MSEQANTDAGAQAANDGGQQTQHPRTYTQEEYDAKVNEVKDLRKESGNYRTKANDFERSLNEFKDGMTKADADKLRADYAGMTETLTKAQERALNADIRATARDLGFTDPSDALALIDRSALKEKDGEVTGVEDALKALAKAKPHLLGATTTRVNVDAGARGATQAKPEMNSIIRGMRNR